ncbi:MAG: PEP-CTERM sorting domain-containing protein [Phycisphaerae bacterium]|jgi:hypothetical protein|nr:PEP-CTERM sorting domain-containing protein [Phycisphaerae bacterium]
MKKLALTLLLVLSVAGMASGETLLSIGFETSEGYTDGSNETLLTESFAGGTGNQGGWYGEMYYTDSQATNTGTVSDQQAKAGTQSLRLPKEDYYYDYYRHKFTLKSTGVLTVSWWRMLENVDTVNKNNYNRSTVIIDQTDGGTDAFPAKNGSITVATPTQSNVTYASAPDEIRSQTGDATETYWDGDSNTEQWVDSTMSGVGAQGAWVGTKVVIDLDAAGGWGSYDLYADTGAGWTLLQSALDLNWNSIGSNPHPTSAPWVDPEGTTYSRTTDPYGLDTFNLYGINGTNYFDNTQYATFIDDILVTWVPEPITMGLLAFGGLGVLLRRRRRR